MTTLHRGVLYKDKGIDITVKSSKGMARQLAPSWDMVMGYKKGTISQDQYIALYVEQLCNIPYSTWQALAIKPERTLLCFCKKGTFCHTYLVIEFAVANYPDLFTTGEDSQSNYL